VLANWATEHGRYVEAVKLVAEPDDADAQVLRDALARSGIPLGFHDTGTDLGRKLADGAGSDGQPPAVFLPDGRVLSRRRDPLTA
jgi:hypothetical protein